MKNFFQKQEVHPSLSKHPAGLASLFFVVMIVALLVWVRPWEPINRVEVNSVSVTAATVKNKMGVSDKMYRWQVVGQEWLLSQRLLSSSHKIAQVTTRVDGSTLHISVVEKINTGFVQRGDQWVELDRNGNPKNVARPDGTAPIYTGFKTLDSQKQIALGVAQLDYVVRHDISQIISSPDSSNRDRIILIMNDGNTVYASQSTFMDKLPYYPSMAAQMADKGIVDLQFGAYSYPYGQKDSAGASSSSTVNQSASQSSS